jgi:hypothetical protein
MTTAEQMVEWSLKNAEGWVDTQVGRPTYYPDELLNLAEAALEGTTPGGLMVEIGCFSGLSTSILLQVARERMTRVLLIDPFVWWPEYAKPRLETLLLRFGDVMLRLEQETSEKVHQMFYGPADPEEDEDPPEDDAIDFIHVDGNHEYPGVKLDCDLWLPHLRSGGTVAFHDYSPLYSGVTQAVDQTTQDWPVIQLCGQHGCMTKRKP